MGGTRTSFPSNWLCAPARARALRLAAFTVALSGAITACHGDSTGPEGGPLILQWPVPGVEGKDWTINNYVDLDPGPGLLDYRGGTKVYDGHLGTDIDVPNFRWMDAGHPVLAAHAGQVVSVTDGNPDRNTSCTGTWNQVTVRHGDGSILIYGHLKRGSITVAVGQRIGAGVVLGVVGSSGCSTAPHLHLELRDELGRVLDPFALELWADPPPYDPPLRVMDVVIKEGTLAGYEEMKDPPPNASYLPAGSPLGFGATVSGGRAGDILRMSLVDGAGAIVFDWSRVFPRDERHTYWYWNRPAEGSVGSWALRVHVNGVLTTHHLFMVR